MSAIANMTAANQLTDVSSLIEQFISFSSHSGSCGSIAFNWHVFKNRRLALGYLGLPAAGQGARSDCSTTILNFRIDHAVAASDGSPINVGMHFSEAKVGVFGGEHGNWQHV